MHIYATIAVPGTVSLNRLAAELEARLAPYNDAADDTRGGKWDGWVLGGRHHRAWIVNNSARECARRICEGLRSWQRLSATARLGCLGRIHDIDLTSITATTVYVDLDGSWHDSRGRGPDEPHWADDYASWIATLPADTWLALLDGHR